MVRFSSRPRATPNTVRSPALSFSRPTPTTRLSQSTILDSAYLDVAGFRAGLFYSWWDDGLSGETDDIGSVVTLHNSLRYQYETGSFYAGLSVDELEDGVFKDPGE